VTFTVAWGAGYEEKFELNGSVGPKSENWQANVSTTVYSSDHKKDTGNGTEITVTCKYVDP
jgi:hypothetical protein